MLFSWMSKMVWDWLGAYHDSLTKSTSRVDIGYAGMNVHSDGHAIFDKNLRQEHSSYLACFDIGIGYEMPLRSVQACPA